MLEKPKLFFFQGTSLIPLISLGKQPLQRQKCYQIAKYLEYHKNLNGHYFLFFSLIKNLLVIDCLSHYVFIMFRNG